MTKGNRLKSLRLDLDLSQTDVAKRIGVTKQTLYKYENDVVTNIPSDKVECLADLYRVSPAYIMGWDDNAFEPDIEDAAEITPALLNDAPLAKALKVYFRLSDDKKKHVINTIYLLGRE